MHLLASPACLWLGMVPGDILEPWHCTKTPRGLSVRHTKPTSHRKNVQVSAPEENYHIRPPGIRAWSKSRPVLAAVVQRPPKLTSDSSQPKHPQCGERPKRHHSPTAHSSVDSKVTGYPHHTPSGIPGLALAFLRRHWLFLTAVF